MVDILVIDDERDIGELIKDILEDDLKLNTIFTLDSASALEILKKTSPKTIILDVWLEGSDMDGLGLLKIIKENYKDIPVIVISGHGNIETATKAIKWGAYDFIEKPFKSEKLILTVKRTIENSELKQRSHQLQQQHDLASLIGKDQQIINIKNKIASSANDNSRILIWGEVGTGKDRLARLLHNYSNLSEKPFFKINIANYSEIELDNLLFGSDGSVSIFEKAKGATLYLNGISELPPKIQAKLLEYLNTLQASENTSKRCKLICASKVDIKELVDSGKFNPDLYQRLSSISLHIPTLRDRKPDIPVISEHYIKQFTTERCISQLEITDDFYSKLISYNWPGNIMELKNFIKTLMIKLMLSGKKTLDSSDVKFSSSKNKGPTNEIDTIFYNKNLKDAKNAFEKKYIDFQLKKFGNNISQAAKFIGMERPALHKKIRDLDL
jgi:two-component system nitrogen regulation response regulator NtrX